MELLGRDRGSPVGRSPRSATNAAALERRHGRPTTTTAKGTASKRSSSNLGDQVLRWQPARRSRKLPLRARGARPNHVGAALSRQERAGRIEEGDGKLYAIQSAETGAPQPAMPSSNLVGVALPDRHLAISPSRCRVMLFEVSFRPDRCHRLPGRARPCTIDTSDMGTPAHAWL